MLLKVLKSKMDDSVNFIFEGNPGYFEARYVRRSPERLAVYLSSQSGCDKACRMCHLTATGQTKLVDASSQNYLQQAAAVFEWYDKRSSFPARDVHFNFMARGEAFANPLFLCHGKELFERLGKEATKRNLIPRFLVSTIMPRNLEGQSLARLFPLIPPEIYYSIYSVRDEFRRKWLPKAMPVATALQMIREYQESKKVVVKLHWAFIEGENDGEEDVALICEAVKKAELHANVAIVRYNPYSEKFGKEPSEEVIMRNAALLKKLLPMSRVKIITRVGLDVQASCGTFIEPKFVQIQS